MGTKAGGSTEATTAAATTAAATTVAAAAAAGTEQLCPSLSLQRLLLMNALAPVLLLLRLALSALGVLVAPLCAPATSETT